MATKMIKAKVVRSQRLSRIYKRIWLASDDFSSSQSLGSFSLLGDSLPNRVVTLVLGEVDCRRSYTISRFRYDEEGTLRSFAIDVVVRDDMARYGITGVSAEKESSSVSNVFINPMAASASPVVGVEVPEGIVSADTRPPGPGAKWAQNAEVGDEVTLEIEEKVDYCLRGEFQTILLVEPVAIPAAENIAKYFHEKVSVKLPQGKCEVLAWIPHKADRRVIEGVEPIWVRPPADFVQEGVRKLQELLSGMEFAEGISSQVYLWVAISSKTLEKIRPKIQSLLSSFPAVRVDYVAYE
ncbi:hypothetical protein KRX54_01010 [Actinomycetaceae bacterium TAE3-ERU4]|nr:hypothetical protein [Actinomycetaceae bacterium TAE3-ERU4]